MTKDKTTELLPLDKERQEFEAWYNDNFTEHSISYQERCWTAWQAAISTRPNAVNTELLEALKDIAGFNDVDGNSMMCDTEEECRDRAKKAISNATAKG